MAGWLLVLCCLEILGKPMAKKFQSQKSALQQVHESSLHLTGHREEGDTTTSAGLNDPWEAQGQTQDSPSPLVDMGF